MKKFVKIIAVLAAAALIAVSLGSCQYLDELKHNHAVYLNDDKTQFEFRGYTYQLLDTKEFGNVQFIGRNDYYYHDYRVTTSDVPVLLSTSFGEVLYCDDSENPVLITIEQMIEDKREKVDTDSGYGYSVVQHIEEKLYFREDKYDEILDTVKNAKVDCYYADLWISDDYEYDSERIRKLLPEDTIKAFKHTLNEKNKISYTKLPRVMAAFNIYPCDKNIIITNNDEYMLFYDNDDFYIADLHDTRGGELYKVADEDKEAFLKFYRQYNEDDVFFEDVTDYFYSDQVDYADDGKEVYVYEGAGSLDNLP